MSQADLMNVHGSAVPEPDDREEGPPPRMPHLSCSATMLDQLFTRVKAPTEELLEDVLDDRRDGVYQHGLQLAGKILEQSHAEGRRGGQRSRQRPLPPLQRLPLRTLRPLPGLLLQCPLPLLALRPELAERALSH